MFYMFARSRNVRPAERSGGVRSGASVTNRSAGGFIASAAHFSDSSAVDVFCASSVMVSDDFLVPVSVADKFKSAFTLINGDNCAKSAYAVSVKHRPIFSAPGAVLTRIGNSKARRVQALMTDAVAVLGVA